MEKKNFAKAAMDEKGKAFVIYVAFFSIIHLARETQIASLLTKKVKISDKYSDYADIFLEEKAAILQKITNLN